MDGFPDRKISRRQFIKLAFSLCLSVPLVRYVLRPLTLEAAQAREGNGRQRRPIPAGLDLALVRGEDPGRMTARAVEALGGMKRFVRKGDVVVIKPNIGWDCAPAQAANTHPAVVAALVERAFQAGAKRVNVFDVTCNDPRRCYENSGIAAAAGEKGAHVYFPDDWNTVEAHFAYPSPLEKWPVLRDAVDCDVFINVPVLKHHSLTGLTLSMKNLMGVCLGSRGIMHQDIGRKLVDLTDFIQPDLTVIDASRVLFRNGPSGGDLNDVIEKKTVIAAVDPTLADVYACRIMDIDPHQVPYLAQALARNFGIGDPAQAHTVELQA